MLTFSVGGCRVEIHFAFVAVACALLLADIGGALPGVLLCVAVHEGGHLLCMALLRVPVRKAVFTGFGIELFRARTPGYLGQAVCILAGPVSNFLLFFALRAAGYAQVALCSLLLGAVHLLPVCPLDGGMALQNLLLCTLSREKAFCWSRRISFAVLLPLAVLGAALLFYDGRNFTLLLLCGYLFLYLLIKRGECV